MEWISGRIPMKFPVVFLVGAWVRLHASMLILWDETPFAADLKQLDETQMVVQPAWSPDPVTLSLSSLREWIGPALKENDPQPALDVRLHLRHGDELSGRLRSMDAEWIQLTTLWGQDIGVRRNMVAQMEVLPPAKDVLLSRPGPRWEWISYARNARADLREVGRFLQFSPMAGNSFTRTMPPLPQRFRLDFRMRALGKDSMCLVQFTPTMRNTASFGGVMLQFQQDDLRVNLYGSQMQPGTDLRMATPKMPTGSQDITLFGDMVAGKYQLWMNNVRVHAWSGPRQAEGVAAMTYQFNLRLNDQNSYLMEDLRLSRWDSAPLQEDVYTPHEKLNRVLFRNADTFRGSVEGFRDAAFSLIDESGTSLRVALISVDRLVFPTSAARKPRRNSRDVLVIVGASRDRLTLQMTGLDDGHLEGKSECFDVPIRLPMSSVSYLRFNLYQSGSRKLASGMP
jgi:hypothetical protein